MNTIGIFLYLFHVRSEYAPIVKATLTGRWFNFGWSLCFVSLQGSLGTLSQSSERYEAANGNEPSNYGIWWKKTERTGTDTTDNAAKMKRWMQWRSEQEQWINDDIHVQRVPPPREQQQQQHQPPERSPVWQRRPPRRFYEDFGCWRCQEPSHPEGGDVVLIDMGMSLYALPYLRSSRLVTQLSL